MVFRPGTSFAGYTIIAPLGAGGMGQVYLVEHPRLQRRQALKVISLAGAGNNEFQRRFTNEARTAASLDHPNIITIHDFGVTDDTPWFSMSYLDGDDLASTRLTDAEVLSVVAQVADALDYAHHHNVIHRDIKPANIVVTRTPTGALHRVVVLDFGIAKLANGVHTSLTATNVLIGTLAYCAPEIIDGDGASPFSDQYALACTAYQLLTGTTPFVADGAPAMMMAHLGKEAAPISAHRPDLAALDAVFTTALAKDSSRRYPTCAAFAANLTATVDANTRATAPTNHVTMPSAPTRHAKVRRYASSTESSDQRQGLQRTEQAQSNPSLAGHRTTERQPHAPSPLPHVAQLRRTTHEQTAPPSEGNQRRSPTIGRSSTPANQWFTGRGRLVGLTVAAAIIVTVAATIVAVAVFNSPGQLKATQVESGGLSSCAIAGDSAYCWGNNDFGQLGDGTTTSRHTPTRVSGLSNPTAITTSGTTSCAIAEGSAYCWGRNAQGQVGDGSTVDRASPIKVLKNATAVSTATNSYGSTTCAISHGKAYCWGANDVGQLGDGTSISRLAPSAVLGLDMTSAIATSGSTTCAIVNSAAYCWGLNSLGQVGDGTTATRLRATQIRQLNNVSAISASGMTTCAIAGQHAYCWGANDYGQLGDGTTELRRSPVAVLHLLAPTSISTGTSATCATAGRRAFCWGSNRDHQLGTGKLSDVTTPTEVATLTNATSISIRAATACAISDASAYCWGGNSDGQVGDGTTTGRHLPTAVSTPT